MIFEVHGCAVDVVASGTIGGGPLDQHVLSETVSHKIGTQKPNIFDKFCKNLEVPPKSGLKSLLQ